MAWETFAFDPILLSGCVSMPVVDMEKRLLVEVDPPLGFLTARDGKSKIERRLTDMLKWKVGPFGR